MARRYNKAKKEKPEFCCRDCANCYGQYSRAVAGGYVLGYCRFRGEGGKYCILLSEPQCEHFVKKVEEAPADGSDSR